MAKVRLNLQRVKKYSVWGNWTNETIICKKIKEIHVNGEILKKSDCFNENPTIQSMNIQNFYRKIIKTPEKITYVKYGSYKSNENYDYKELYLKDGKLHCLSGPAERFDRCIEGSRTEYGEYYILGQKYMKDDWLNDPNRLKWLRENKLNRVVNEEN